MSQQPSEPAEEPLASTSPAEVSTATSTGQRRLVSATAVMASGTMISRVLGLVRAMLIAFILGNGTMRADVLSLALTVPSSLYLLLAGGTLNNVLVPQIVRAVKHDADGGKAFVDRIMTGFLLIIGTLTMLFTVAAPLVMTIYTSASWRAPDRAEHWRSLLLMSYITMPQIFFYGVFFLIGQVLNAREKFGPMMWAPILNNVVSIASLSVYLWVWGTQTSNGLTFTDQQVWVLGIGSTLGIIAQTLVLLPYLKAAGFRYRPRFDLRGTGLGQTFHVAKWMVGYVALTSLAQVVVTNLASGGTVADVGGGVNAYANAYLIWVLPHSLITVSLATAMLPAASAFAQSNNLAGVAEETNRALRLALTFLVPASLAFIALADPITRVPYGNGAGADDYHLVAWALMAFGIGLVPFTIQYLYLRAFYALDNTKTPFLLQIWVSGANAALAVVLVLSWDSPTTVAARLALAYSASYFLGVFLTHRALRKRLPQLDGRQTWRHLTKLLVPSALAAGLAWVITWWFAGFPNVLLRLVGLALAGLVAVLVFFFLAKRMGIPEAASLLNILRRNKPDDGESDAVESIVEEADQEDDQTGPASSAGSADPTDWPNPDPDGAGIFVAAPPTAPDDSGALEDPEPDSSASVGQVLAQRYELTEQLAIHEGTQTWRAHDLVLDRDVLAHLLPAGDQLSAAVADAARAAAIATDSRFLRVLDVAESGAELDSATASAATGSYLVYEYAAGQTLERLLQLGPLTSAEAGWIVREIADALAPLHAQGHFHRHLNPATILISANGNLKILGFEVDAARHPGPGAEDPEASDVQSFGELLYACLTGCWPHGARFGLPAAPVVGGQLAPADRVQAGANPALSQVVDRICSPVPAGRASRLTSAQAITTELSMVLGPISAAQDLRGRVDPLGEALGDTAGMAAQIAPPVPTPAASRTYVSSPLPEDSADTGETVAPFVTEALSRGDQFTPVPPPSGSRGASMRDFPLLTGLAVVVAAVGLITALITSARPLGEAPATILAIATVDDFDPKADGGSGGENSAKARLAADGDLNTVWFTEKYRAADLGTKPGVGVILDLGAVHKVSEVKVNFAGRGTDVELRIPSRNVALSPTKSVQNWRVLTGKKDVGDVAEFDLPDAPSTRYLLVYLTSLPAIGNGRYQGGIAEVRVSSPS